MSLPLMGKRMKWMVFRITIHFTHCVRLVAATHRIHALLT